MSKLTRRTLIGAAAGLAGTAALPPPRAESATAALPTPAASGIDHIVVVMMENRSFDHYLGWLPGADGRQGGLSYLDRADVRHATHHLTDYQGCDHPDPDHSYEGGRVQYNGGRCDGWLRSGQNDEFAIGYYTDADLAFYGKAARYWTAFDRYFSATMAETYPNRFYQHSAQTDRIHNSTDQATMPTIWDRLADAGVSRAYYYYDVPFLALYGTKYLSIARTYPQFLADAQAGTLPAVSFLDAQRVRPHLGPQDDRVAVAPARADRARRRRPQPGRGARLQQGTGPHRATLERARRRRPALPGRTVRRLRGLEETRRNRAGTRLAGQRVT
ncbi:alkaline phosphatase family protein [Planosporangium mesophilum]|uniref:phospholipase C n=1 Tax=Planosporangium mesophilum TaxID=689768 RepID=A0A8J3TEE9_9ACTN|nr:alkaline phosphatase family protein [Planosporangium mesophilum]GII23966.1 hypothetical protein Pme01_35630 [Planosporangium mesophilum]